MLPAVIAAALVAGQLGASRTALAIVSDARDRTTVDVGADDFVVEESGQAREILSVRVADYPIVILVDNGAAAKADFPLMKKAVERFLARLGPRPVAIGTLADPPALATSLDDEREHVVEAIEAMEVRDGAPSMMLAGAAAGAEAIRATGVLFSALIVLSSTATDASHAAPEELIAPVVDSTAVVHVIANRSNQLTAGGAPARGDQLLKDVAQQTRGEYTAVYTAASYDAALDRLATRLTSEMMVEYLVPPGSKPVDVKLGVKLPGAKVRGLGVAPR
jgi:hypothetical protein